MNHLPIGRLEVAGDSMAPTLRPGDRVVVVRWLPLRVGDLVALTDPRDPARTLVKRVAAIDPAGIVVRGDNDAASTDSRHFGPVGPGGLWGRVVYRYHPDQRRGWLTKRTPRRWKLPPG